MVVASPFSHRHIRDAESSSGFAPEMPWTPFCVKPIKAEQSPCLSSGLLGGCHALDELLNGSSNFILSRSHFSKVDVLIREQGDMDTAIGSTICSV
eukprot:Skav232272  [mRNA]  locus=scaffold882:160196:160483:- [translate_table: standard]